MKKELTLLVLFFTLGIFADAINPRTIVNITSNTTVGSYTDKEVIVDGKCDLHLTLSPRPLINSIIRLNSENSWLFIDNMKPSLAIDSVLKYLYVNDKAAINKSNVRVAIYKHGTVIMPRAAGYKPLTVYTGQNFTGDSAKYALYSKYTSLGTVNNKIRSFILKRGYMATLATGTDGTGYSRVYIADNEDLLISTLPIELDQLVSFIRTFNWEWVTKKGWCQTGADGTPAANMVNATWLYSWSADQASSSTIEYVPIRQNGGWPGWDEIGGKQGVTHVLGFNEPDHTEQSNLTVQQALSQWPDMLRTGLRIGSPACTNFSWLYQFMDSCKARNYRVDYVAVHGYWGGKTPQNWYNDLKYIHDRTGRPIWITEWNNGANWTSEWWPSDVPSQQAKQLADIKGILTVLDTAHFIERYSIYNWVEDKRAMILNGVLTPAGKYYSSNKSEIAFNRSNEFIPTLSFTKPYLSISFGSKSLTVTISDPNGEYYKGFILEKKLDNGSFVEIVNSDIATLKFYSDTLDINTAQKTRYRVKSKLSDGSISNYSNEVGFDTSNGGDIQFGVLSVSNVGWNPVYFKIPYTATPSIIVGSPTNKNNTVLLSSRVKLISYASRFNVQIAPWAYQKVTSLTKEDEVPYFITNPGSYDFGGLKAISGINSVSSVWTPVTFATPFDTIPVVFVSQLNSSTSYPTTVRVRKVTKTGFEARIQKERAITSIPNAETVSYFAITTGKGMIDHKKVIVGKTVNNGIGASGYASIMFGDSIANPIFIAQMQTCNDDTTATLRTLTLTAKYANVAKQREKSTSTVSGLAETGGWMVLDPKETLVGVPSLKVEELRIYPNPAKDIIYLSQTQTEGMKVEIYNVFGTLIKGMMIFNNQVDISSLPSGCYILKTANYGTKKFIKI
jgi:Glycosyl hydrolase catalytic core/Secretion system C-terminal sorting domain/H-type lectin domain